MLRFFGAIFGFIIGLFRRKSQRRRMNRQLDSLDVQNENQKNVVNYNNCPIEAFLSNDRIENIVVSGVNDSLRDRVSCAAAWKCHEAGRGAVILHFSNQPLSNLMASTFRNDPRFHLINHSNSNYDPLVSLQRNEISQFVLTSSGVNYKIERSGMSYLYGLIDYLQLIGRPISIDTIYNCLLSRDHEQIMEAVERGEMTYDAARRINAELSQGQIELGNIEQYFSIFKQQGSGILATETSIRDAISIKSALQRNEIIMIDLGGATNSLLINVVVQEIRDAISRGLRFSLIVDSIPLDASEAMGQLFRNFAGACNYVYSSQDVYADTQSTANVFETLIGRASKVFVLRHYSSVTSRKFSEFLGQYQKIEVNHTFTSGDNYMAYGQILPGSSTGDVYGTQYVVKPRVEEHEITAQSMNHVFIKQNGTSEIISVRCTSGDATRRYDAPRPSRGGRPTRRRSRRISWWTFALLFIFCTPISFIYSFVKTGRVGKIISSILFVLTIIGYVVVYQRMM